jgi:hypothetical protein
MALMPVRKRKHKRRPGARGALIKGMTKKLPSEILGDPVFEEKLTELLRGHSGIYVLYKDDSVYYVGLARSLHGRVRWHLRDRHAGKWNSFKVFLIQRVGYLKDIETLVLNIAMPKGNRALGRLPRSGNLNRALWEVLKEHQRKIRGLRKALR